MSSAVNSSPHPRSLTQLLGFTLRGHWPAAGALFLLLLFTYVMEGIGFSLVIPLLQAILSPGELAGGNVLQRALAEVSGLIPQDWRIVGLLGLLIIVFSLKSLGLIAASGLTRWFVATLRMNWVVTAFLATIRAPYSEVAARPHGETLQNIIGETETAARGVLLVIEAAARVIQITVLMTILLLANWQATLFVLAIGVAAFALSWRNTGRLSINAGTTRQAIRQRANDVVSESITGLRTVKLLDIAGSRTKQLRQMLRVSRRVDALFEVVSSSAQQHDRPDCSGGGIRCDIFMTVVLDLRFEEAIPTIGSVRSCRFHSACRRQRLSVLAPAQYHHFAAFALGHTPHDGDRARANPRLGALRRIHRRSRVRRHHVAAPRTANDL